MLLYFVCAISMYRKAFQGHINKTYAMHLFKNTTGFCSGSTSTGRFTPHTCLWRREFDRRCRGRSLVTTFGGRGAWWFWCCLGKLPCLDPISIVSLQLRSIVYASGQWCFTFESKQRGLRTRPFWKTLDVFLECFWGAYILNIRVKSPNVTLRRGLKDLRHIIEHMPLLPDLICIDLRFFPSSQRTE